LEYPGTLLLPHPGTQHMATEPAEAPEGFTKADAPSSNREDDTEWIDRPQVGEMVQGMILDLEPNCGNYDTTVLELRLMDPYGSEHEAGDVVAMWSTSGIDDQLEASADRGDEIAIVCDEVFEYEDDEGETQQGREYTVYVSD